MKNILKIIMNDNIQIFSNVVAVVVVIGLCILPSLYAWFNINSNWDPYAEDATSNLKIAVYSNDKGVEIKDSTLVIGDSVIDALKNNHVIGWCFPEDERTAVNGVYSGEYYAALVIPEDFTQSIVAILDGETSGGKIIYYSNEKKNAIATKITSKAKNAVESQVNSEVFGTITEVVCEVGEKLEKMDENGGYESKTPDIIRVLKQDIQNNINMLASLKQASDAAESTLSTLSTLAPKMVKDINEDLSLLSASSVPLSSVQAVGVRLEDYVDLLNRGGANLTETEDMLKDLKKLVSKAEADLLGLADSEEADSFIRILEHEPEKVGAYFSSFVHLKTIPVYKTENYGSAMAPFYTVLALWVGSLILVAIIHTRVKPTANMYELKPYQEYFGRLFFFLVLGQIQTLICVLGDLFFLNIQCKHPFLFWFGSAMTSLTFTILIFSLTFAFGNIGEAIAVVIMVIQVAGAGGTFPKEVLPMVYQKIYDFLPFPYCMNALRECVSGFYKNDYWTYIGYLVIFIVVSIFIGLVVRIPFIGLNERIEKSKENTDLMV